MENGTPIWQGACHCRRTRFEVHAEIDHARICDCSICHQRGALIFRVAEDALKLMTSLDDLALYQWGTGSAKDYFCKTCGILPFRRPRAISAEEQTAEKFSGWAVNLRCIEGLATIKLPIRQIRGHELALP